MVKYFYQKKYYRIDGEVYVKRYSRSFPLGEPVEKRDEAPTSNVSQASLSRAKSRVRLIAFSNPQLASLLTLTFRDCPSEEEAHCRFDLFRRKVARSYKGWQFLGTKELQKRGSIHFHLLVNFCPDMQLSPHNNKKFICGYWEYGFSDYSIIRGDDQWRTELYLLKYLGKDDQKLFKTYYVRSRNLSELKPVHYPNIEPIHPRAEHIFLTRISNKFVDRFDILEYTYSITTKHKGKEYAHKY